MYFNCSVIFLTWTKVYHCNINSVGRICHNIFDRNYNAQITMRDILNAVYGLLIIPEPEDPLDRLDSIPKHTHTCNHVFSYRTEWAFIVHIWSFNQCKGLLYLLSHSHVFLQMTCVYSVNLNSCQHLRNAVILCKLNKVQKQQIDLCVKHLS